jgi:hypothetical protein
MRPRSGSRSVVRHRKSAALRVDAGHHVLDGAVLARGIHRLKDQQDGPRALRVQFFLHCAQALGTVREQIGGFFFRRDAVGVVGIDVAESEAAAVGNPVSFHEPGGVSSVSGGSHR